MADQEELGLEEPTPSATPQAEAEPAAEPDAEHAGGQTPEAAEPPVSAPPSAELEERLARAESERQREREERIRLEERQKAAEAKPEPPKPDVTPDQLQSAVDEGRLSHFQATQIQIEQEKRKQQAEFDRKLAERDAQSRQQARLDQEYAAYREKVPALFEQGSDAWNRVRDEAQELVNLGAPPDALSTELAAIRAVYGPSHKIRDISRSRRPTHQETGGTGPGKPGERPVDAANRCPAPYRDYYQTKIDQGQFSGWGDKRLLKILKHVPGYSTASH